MAKLFTFKNLVNYRSLIRQYHNIQESGRSRLKPEIVISKRNCCYNQSFWNLSNQSQRYISTSSGRFGRKEDEEFEKNYIEVPPPPPPSDDPVGRTVRILKHDFQSIYTDLEPLLPFSSHVDIVIIGGGIMGSCLAYMIKNRTALKALSVMVIEKDPNYSQSTTALSLGCLRQKFSLKENIEMARFGAEFLRQVPQNLQLDGVPPPDIKYHPYGCLQLANEENAETMQETFLLQKQLGCHVELLTKQKLEQRFPWMNSEDVELGLLGQEGEGWFDAWALHFALKRKAYFRHTEYVHGEVVGFGHADAHLTVCGMDMNERHMNARRVIVRTPKGELKTVDFSKCVIAAGYESSSIAEMCNIGRKAAQLSVAMPVEARKRNVYCIHAPNGPGIDCPMVINTDGTYFRREGYAGHFIAGHAPELEEKPYDKKVEVDYEYFDNKVWPSLKHRVPGFNEHKLNSAWVGLYDYNRFDQSAIVGLHPYYPSIYFACGFSGYGIQLAPAIARATMELMLDGEFRTIDLHKFDFERFFVGKKTEEKLVA